VPEIIDGIKTVTPLKQNLNKEHYHYKENLPPVSTHYRCVFE
jgi:hypothetical protein